MFRLALEFESSRELLAYIPFSVYRDVKFSTKD